VNYFAYGSNMSQQRLLARIPVRRVPGVFRLEQHELRFHKIGKDGSAKCDAYFTDTEIAVYGVLYEVQPAGKQLLDRIEGLGRGYGEKEVAVYGGGGTAIEAVTYCATHIDESLLPFTWYKQHVLRGAQEAGLPSPHIDQIAAAPALQDPDRTRAMQELSVYTAARREPL
jgi:gamma-glutamylcyclotransferase